MPLKVVEYLDEDGASPFASWFLQLNPVAAAKVRTVLTRIELGTLSSVKSVGEGVLEYRIDSGPGYRVYFGRDGDTLVILLCGGTKRRQDRDIQTARQLWLAYKKRKRGN
jgi:putative addiction module killer protein